MNDDLISRSALFKTWDALDETQDPNLLVDAMIKATQQAPAVDAEVVRHGKWILNKHYGDYECSACGEGNFRYAVPLDEKSPVYQGMRPAGLEPAEEGEMMAKKKPAPVERTCGECIHEFACAMWTRGNLHNTNAKNCSNYETVKDSAAYLIGLLDKPNVVRCKDCKYWQLEPMGSVMMCYGAANGKWTKPDFFCAAGERKMDSEVKHE